MRLQRKFAGSYLPYLLEEMNFFLWPAVLSEILGIIIQKIISKYYLVISYKILSNFIFIFR